MDANQLRADILNRWGSTGDWNQGGIDRALELARLFEANGITDLSGLRLGNTTEHFGDAQTWRGGVAEFEQFTPAHDVQRQQLLFGDRALGFLGDSNNDNTLGRIGERQYLGDNGMLGWSAQGHGNVSFYAVPGPDGQLQVQPVWGSSSDAADARQAAMAIAAMVAMAYGIPAGEALGAAEGAGAAVATGAAEGAAAGGAAAGGGGIAGGSGLTIGSGAGYGSIGTATGLGGTGAGLSITPTMTAAFTTPQLAAMGAAGAGSALGASGAWGSAGGSAAGGASGSGGGSAGLSSADRAAMLGNSGYGSGMTGAQTTAFDTVSGLTGSNSLGAAAAEAAGGNWTGALQGLGGSMDWTDLARLGLAAYGASQSRDGSTTQSRDPWAPAQPFLQQLLGQGQQLAQQYQQQPFSQQQQTAYNNVGGLLNAINRGAGGLLSGMQANASGANNYDRSNTRRPLQGSSFSLGGFQPGLLNFFPQTGGR